MSVAWPQSRVHARGVRPMHARAVGVGAPDPERGSVSTSSAVGGRRSEGLVRPSTASQPPLRTRRASARSGWAAGLILRQRHTYFHAFENDPENTSNKPLFLLFLLSPDHLITSTLLFVVKEQRHCSTHQT